jgi:hypothetical protein
MGIGVEKDDDVLVLSGGRVVEDVVLAVGAVQRPTDEGWGGRTIICNDVVGGIMVVVSLLLLPVVLLLLF